MDHLITVDCHNRPGQHRSKVIRRIKGLRLAKPNSLFGQRHVSIKDQSLNSWREVLDKVPQSVEPRQSSDETEMRINQQTTFLVGKHVSNKDSV